MSRIWRLRHHRHVLWVSAIKQRHPFETEVLELQAELFELFRDALLFELLEVLYVVSASREGLLCGLEAEHLHHVDGREPPTHDDRAIDRIVVLAGVLRVALVVERDDERVLIEQPLAHEVFGIRHRQRPIPPSSASEHDRREAPASCELVEAQITTDFGVGQEMNSRLVEFFANVRVFLVAQRGVPTREAVFDLSVGARVLVDDVNLDPDLGEAVCYLGPCGGAANHQNRV